MNIKWSSVRISPSRVFNPQWRKCHDPGPALIYFVKKLSFLVFAAETN